MCVCKSRDAAAAVRDGAGVGTFQNKSAGELPALGGTHWMGRNNMQVCFVLAGVSTAQYIRDRFGADTKVTIGRGMRRE